MQAYLWQVTHSDNTVVCEYGDERDIPFLDVIQKPVKKIELVLASPQREIQHVVQIPDGATPIFFRRKSVMVNAAVSGPKTLAHCIGWIQEGRAVYLFVFADGGTLLTSDLQAV